MNTEPRTSNPEQTTCRNLLCCCYLLIVVFTASCQPGKEKNTSLLFAEEVSSLYDSTLSPFYHGVASGDPLQDRVIIWTRVTPKHRVERVAVRYEVSEDQSFSTILRSDTVSTTPAQDYTAKIDVDNLRPGQYYYYRFHALNKTSPIGRTKTLPAATSIDSLTLAVVSCSNWEFGYFNAYDRIAEKEVDAVLHLGDYIYEYGEGGYGNKALNRKHLPAHEIVTLEDYRTRYSQYHLDQGLRHVRQRHPLITIWDDHEVANDTYVSGAQNHQPDKEGDFNQRKAAAKQAYYEWLPIRENKNLYRSFSFGTLADLITLDERLAGRTKPVGSLSDPAIQQEEHTMLGKPQFEWLKDKLQSSKATWKIIGNQVIFSDLDQSFASKSPKNLDSRDGYPAEKKRIAELIQRNAIEDVIFLAGDTHASWGFEVAIDPIKTYNKKTSKGAFAIELGTTSITSSNWNEGSHDDTVKIAESKFLALNPHLRYINLRDHGYLLLTLHQHKAKAEWFYVESLKDVNKNEFLGKTLEIKKGTHTLK